MDPCVTPLFLTIRVVGRGEQGAVKMSLLSNEDNLLSA